MLQKLYIDSNLNPKIAYLVDEGFKIEEINEYLLKNPSIIPYSLKNKIIPRIEYLKYKGIKPMSLSEVFSYLYPSDEKFIRRLKILVNADIVEYEKFKNK